MQRLQEHGYVAVPVNPAFTDVLGERCYPSIADVPGPVDTVTHDLNADRSTPLIQDILKAKPRRISFHPNIPDIWLTNDSNGIRGRLLAPYERPNRPRKSANRQVSIPLWWSALVHWTET